ncbi:DUF6440 family protein [Mammaliicoccus sciuri]|uniref:DUF6440 family protein n=1 Tax=Mammaliicoccus TaxID=2803850 RepID=UPI00073500FC|nr:DUF6440 family protein [Mammaliicoccus sciuri]KTT87181.1 hypothetical protein NS1R_00370 [Mammaliicoccus sciuri]KTT90689.1 hypothetical protein NS112_02330 [Mammaliicoccus sciuri]KTT91145.1 hypothetical protein NS36R_04275 [Mammaliicoccus sciuri]KTT95358.1 hypothetical protein NS44R_01205 [Mammaliicoccus sciuri]KTW11370.1 hypothetical protein RSA37_09330 [Mammaliicoccus sciuri]
MFGNKDNDSKDNNRFFVKSVDNVKGLGRISILVDRETGVNYINAWVGTGSGLTPLLDESGKPVIDKV